MSDQPTPETVERLWRIADAARVVARNPAHIGPSVQAVQRLRKALAELNATYPEPVTATR